MTEKNISKRLGITVASVSICMLTACNGIFDGIYDQPASIVPAKGQIVVDATSWTDWYYVDLEQLHQLEKDGDSTMLLKAQTEFTPYPIPMNPTGDKDETEEGHNAATQGKKPGQYMYWFDVWGQGVKKNTFAYFTPTAAQPEPAKWTFAVHRNNVRTNKGAVLETSYTSMDQLPETSDAFHNKTFTEDEWSENEVWDSQKNMLQSYVPSQGILVNKVLSSWLTMDIPPMPPAFTYNNHVFILRLQDGTYAALQLANYLSPQGKTCYLAINYKYPF